MKTDMTKAKQSECDKRWLATVGGGNAVEVARVSEGRVLFDHASGAMRAEWDDGSTEHWHLPGHGYGFRYSYETKLKSFRDCVERWSEP